MARRRGRGERRYGYLAGSFVSTPYVFCVRLLDVVSKTHRVLRLAGGFPGAAPMCSQMVGWRPESGGDCKRQGFQELKYQEENR
jgi:hypothetical protein